MYNYVIILSQVQCQLFCTRSSYCDFLLWTQQDIFEERIYPDEEFWLEKFPLVKRFHTTAILPELLGKFFSHTHSKPAEMMQSEAGSNENTLKEGLDS